MRSSSTYISNIELMLNELHSALPAKLTSNSAEYVGYSVANLKFVERFRVDNR